MNNKVKIGLVLTIVLAVAILAGLWVLIVHEAALSGLGQRRLQPNSIAGDFEAFYLVSTVVSTINIALLVILLITFVNVYVKTKSPFTVGLIIFSLALLINNLVSNSIFMEMFTFHAYGLGPFAFLPDIFELVALTVLLYLSLKY